MVPLHSETIGLYYTGVRDERTVFRVCRTVAIVILSDRRASETVFEANDGSVCVVLGLFTCDRDCRT